jgi:biopolymer transport protein ExbD
MPLNSCLIRVIRRHAARHLSHKPLAPPIVWNGKVVAGLPQLESYFHAAVQKNPQPEIHLRADRGVKYDLVAKVLASAQHNRMEKMGFVNTAEFNH